VVLPTIPGYYIGTVHGVGTVPLWQLGAEGEWWYVGNENRPVAGGSWKEDPKSHLPLILLRPVPEVASEVLAYIEDKLWGPGDTRYFTYANAAKVATHFGVTP